MVPKLRAPIVLVHGLFGYGRVRVGGVTLANYFPGIVEALEAGGNRVYVPNLSPTGGVVCRAGQLKAFIQKHLANEPVHLVAHSMGGLDARYMISCLGMAKSVLTLTTLGTPHRGTTFADWGINRLERAIKPILDFVGLPTDGFYDVTTARCRLFNEQVRDAADVRYFSIAGRFDGGLAGAEFLIPHRIVLNREGANDGLVSVASATYGERLDIWDGDHLSLVNLSSPLGRFSRKWSDPSAKYGSLMARLAGEGY